MRQVSNVASSSKTEFLRTMSHEFPTPINAILGFSESMKLEVYGPLSNSKYVEYANDIYSSGQRLMVLITDLLEMSEIEADKLELHEEQINIGDVINSVYTSVLPHADAAKIEMKKSIPASPLDLFADKRRINQILLNLVTNAVKFTPKWGCVSISAMANEDGSLSVVIDDDGIGMNQEGTRLALTKFSRVQSVTAGNIEGRGFGLPLAVELMNAHDGTLEIDSKLDHGT